MGSVPSSHSTGIMATTSATPVSFRSFTKKYMSPAVITNAMPKKVRTPRAPLRMSPTALAKPMMCTEWFGPSYLPRSASSLLATSK